MVVAVLWLVQAAAERAPDRIRTVDGLVAEICIAAAFIVYLDQ